MNTIVLSNALITNPNGGMLAVRKEGSPYFMMAGGKIEAGETAVEALARELLEELNLDIQPYALTALGSHTTTAVNEANTLVHSTVFHLEIPILDLQAQAEIAEILWLYKSNYQQYPLAHLLEEFSLPIWLKM